MTTHLQFSRKAISLFAVLAISSEATAGSSGLCGDVFSTSHRYLSTNAAELRERSTLPQTNAPQDQWIGAEWGWGPWPKLYPVPEIPLAPNPTRWRQMRVEMVATNLIGLPYRHFHIPAMGGLDCSNFTSWVYNFALGLKIDSNVERQAFTAGRLLHQREALQPGDLLFVWSDDRSRISHVGIYLDPERIIDSARGGVEIRPLDGKYRTRFAWARRVIAD